MEDDEGRDFWLCSVCVEGNFQTFGELSLWMKGSTFCFFLFFCILLFLFQCFSHWRRVSLRCGITFFVNMYDIHDTRGSVCPGNKDSFKAILILPMRWEWHLGSQNHKAGWSCHSCNARCHAMPCHIYLMNCPNKTHPSQTTNVSDSASPATLQFLSVLL